MTDLLTIDQVARLLDCSTDTVADRLARNELPGVKYGRSWRIPAAALHEHLNAEAMRNLSRRAPPQPAATAQPPKPARRPPSLVALP